MTEPTEAAESVEPSAEECELGGMLGLAKLIGAESEGVKTVIDIEIVQLQCSRCGKSFRIIKSSNPVECPHCKELFQFKGGEWINLSYEKWRKKR